MPAKTDTIVTDPAGGQAGYYFQPYRSDRWAAYYNPATGPDRRGRYLGDHFLTPEDATRAIRAARARTARWPR